MTPKLTFLLSALDKSSNLWVSLGSLLQQTLQEWECLVLINHPMREMADSHLEVIKKIGDSRINAIHTYHDQPGWDSYWAADWALHHPSHSEWLAFPSDDSYLCPEFAGLMTAEGELNKSDLVLCDILYDCRLTGQREFLITAPEVGKVDKTSFIVRRKVWKGWGEHKPSTYGQSNCDGEAIDALVKGGMSHSKVGWPLIVHN